MKARTAKARFKKLEDVDPSFFCCDEARADYPKLAEAAGEFEVIFGTERDRMPGQYGCRYCFKEAPKGQDIKCTDGDKMAIELVEIDEGVPA